MIIMLCSAREALLKVLSAKEARLIGGTGSRAFSFVVALLRHSLPLRPAWPLLIFRKYIKAKLFRQADDC